MYSLAGYGEMLAEPVRQKAYVESLAATITPGCVVLEIGTGPGVFALLAARLGARKVYAVEPSDVIEVGRQLATANGLADRVEFLQGLSTQLELPEKADVLLSDLRGILPLFRNSLTSSMDARDRLLAPNGTLIPRADSLWASVVDAEDLYADISRGWCDHGFDLDLSSPLGLVRNMLRKARFQPEQCLVEAQCWAELDYRTIGQTNIAGRLTWEATGAGRAHGLAVWFDTLLTAEIGFSNAPGRPELIYGQGFFPFPSPVELQAGDRIEVDLAAALVGEDYVWQWTTTIKDVSGARAHFEQSSFDGLMISPATLRKRAATYIPKLNEEGEILQFVLARMDSAASLEAIARALQAAYPARFAHWREALTRIGEVAASYSSA